MRDIGLLPPGLELEVRASGGLEVYRYTDASDNSSVLVAVDNAGLMSVWETIGQPEMPVRVMRWLCDRADYLADGPR